MSRSKSLVNLDEIERFGDALKAFQSGAMDDGRYMATRMLFGVYTQRQEGYHMIRAKLPGGRVKPGHLGALADIAERYSGNHPVVHVTTRQDIQLHFIPVDKAAEVLRELGEAGLTTREACGNTIRNVTTCALAGVCPKEHLDVTPVLDGLVDHTLRHPLTQNLPRKFKVSVSGCESDCAQSLMQDLGIVAVRREDGRFGWKVLAGGGLGHKPHEAVVVEAFAGDEDLLVAAEAVISLHNRYSDRSKRAKSRIKYLVDRFGEEGFVEQYRQERKRVQLALAGKTLARLEWTGGRRDEAPGAATPSRIFKQKQAGLYTFPVNLPLGAITAGQLRGLKAIAEALDLTEIRTTTDQNLLFLNVPEARLSALEEGLQKLNLRIVRAGDNVVACSGTTTCPLGLTASPDLAEKLDGGPSDLRIRVSGCVNGCAQPEAGDIGLYGEGKRVFKRLVPHYQITLGGTACQNAYSHGKNLAALGPAVPARRAAEAVQRIKADYAAGRAAGQNFIDWSRAQPEGHFNDLLADLLETGGSEVDALARDVGSDSAFAAQAGANECAGPRKQNVAPAFTQAAHERSYRDAFMTRRRHAEALESAEAILLHLGKTLLPKSLGGVPLPVAGLGDLVFRANSPRAPQPRLGAQLEALAEMLDRIKAGVEPPPLVTLAAFFEEVDAWTLKVAEYWAAHEFWLDLQPWLPAVRQAARTEDAPRVAMV